MWAQSYTDGEADSPYVFDSENKTITVDYSKMALNSEAPDAFYAVQKISVTSSNTPVSIKLYRPFAQVNVGTDDLEEAKKLGIEGVTKSKLAVNGMPNVLNMIDGTTSGSVNAYNYAVAQAAAPNIEEEAFPVEGYDYIAMVYVLAPKSQNILAKSMTLTINDKTSSILSLTNVPVQGNFRTNIYGSLLTKQKEFNVEIVPQFNGTYQGPQDPAISKWNGTDASTEFETVTEEIDGKQKTVVKINSAADLAGFAASVKAGNKYANQVIRLEADINLDGKLWESVSNFSGTFDGNGHTIYNLYVDHEGNSAGMFGSCVSATFKNITIDGAYVKGTGKWNGVLLGYSYSTMEGIVVKNATLEIPKEGGIICGFQASDSSGFIKNCQAIDCTIIAASTWDVGQIAGSVRKGAVVDCEAINVTGSTKLVGREI